MRIGIVNDVMLAREALRRAIVSATSHQVAWQARDGAEAVAMAVSDRPDLILMDLIMPGIDGVEATRRIMAEAPCSILVVTASVTGHIGRVYDAMSLGALDVVATPEMGLAGNMAGASVLLEKIATIAKLIGRPPRLPIEAPPPPAAPKPSPPRVVPRPPPAAPPESGPPSPSASPLVAKGLEPSWPLVVIGASTGGPAAIAKVLSGIPDNRDASIVIVQHLDLDFIPGLARSLQDQTGRKVELTVPGDRPLPGRVLLAATMDHLVLDHRGRFAIEVEPLSNPFRPSVDEFFASVARHWKAGGAAVLLTGMLRDGAEGLLKLRRAGWLTIAQDKETSVVWGMPRAAAEIGAAELILPVSEIAAAVVERVRDRSFRSPEKN